MTAQGTIARAMRLIGALGTGEAPTAAEAKDGLEALNKMVSGWAKQRLTIALTTRSTEDLVSGTAAYTIGPDVVAPNFIQVVPATISGVAIVASDGTETPLKPYTEDEYRLETNKVQTGQPARYRFKRSHPEASITFWPVPDAAYEVALYWPEPLGQFATLTTQYLLSDGYEDALDYNLAVHLAPEFGKALDQTVAALASETLATIKRANTEDADLTVDPALLIGSAGYSILNG
jgi:hypothetical protein